MKKNLIIAIETIIILGLIVLFYSATHQHKPSRVVRFPETKLGTNERITRAQMIFQTTHIKAIRKIPPGWYTDIDLDTPANPIFKGSIIDGAAALESTGELPEFEVENYIKNIEPKALKVILVVAKYPGNLDKQRQIEVELSKP